MQTESKATSLWSDFFKLGMPQIRAFHMSWFAFFLCIFAWFGIAPLMIVGLCRGGSWGVSIPETGLSRGLFVDCTNR